MSPALPYFESVLLSGLIVQVKATAALELASPRR